MTKRTRYSLIVVGFVVFLILAPLISFYVAGLKFNSLTGRFAHTGILAASIDPKDAAIYIDGQKRRDNSGSVRFLLPGEYQVEIKKSGYFVWRKHLDIKENQVTWANPLSGKLNLFYSIPEEKNLANNVNDAVFLNRHLYFLQPGHLVSEDLLPFGVTKNFLLPKSPSQILPSLDGRLLALINTSSPPTLSIFDTNTEHTTDYSNLISQGFKAQFDSNNNLLVLEGNNLFQLNFSGQTKTLQFSNVSAFQTAPNGLYLLQLNSAGSTASLKFIDPSSRQAQILYAPIPAGRNMQIIVSPAKQIFIISDGSLYKVGGNLEKLADNTQAWSFDETKEGLVFIHASEADYYNFSQQEISFITRTALPLGNPDYSSNLGFAFLFKGDQLNAIELDNRDQQNEYTLYRAKSPKKFFLNPENNTLYVLDGGALNSLKIR